MSAIANVTIEQIHKVVEKNILRKVDEDVGEHKSLSWDKTFIVPTYVNLNRQIPDELCVYLKDNKENYTFATISERSPNVGITYTVDPIDAIMYRILNEEKWEVPYASYKIVRFEDNEIKLEEEEILTLDYYEVE